MNKTELLTRLAADADERLVLARVMDKLELARNRSVPAHTFFLTLAQQEAAERLIAACGHPAHLFWGGWEKAERKLIAFLPDWMEPEDFTGSEDAPIAALTLTPSGEEKLTHRDYLGAILGLGLTREKIGDLLVGEGVCQVLLLREVEHVLLTQLDQVGRARVKVTACPLAELQPPEQKTRTIRTRWPPCGWTPWRPPVFPSPGARWPASSPPKSSPSTAGSATSPTGWWRPGTCSPAGAWASACSRRCPAPPRRAAS